jgi:ParB family chromosome partitioning protein
MVSAASETATGKRRRFTVDALFTDHRPQAIGVIDLPIAKEIRLDRIEPDSQQPRRTFDETRLGELIDSIKIEGVLQPIVVRYHEPRDIYIIVHGERRWRASKEAGLDSIPALVRDVPEDRRLIQQLMENVVREDLTAIDRAAALRTLKKQLGDAPWEAVAEAVGIRRSRLFQLLGTAKLPEEIQNDIRAGRLSEKQSRALQGLTPGHQLALRDAILAFELSSDEATSLSRSLRMARLPDDPAAAMAAIADLRSRPGNTSQKKIRSNDDLTALLQTFSRNGSVHLHVVGNEDVTFDAKRLRTEVHVLARSLAAAPASELKRGADTRQLLETLRNALDALLKS